MAEKVCEEMAEVTVDATGLIHQQLNARLRELVWNGTQKIVLHNVYGQRYYNTLISVYAKT